MIILTEKPLLEPYIISYSMKAVIFRLIVLLFVLFLLIFPSAAAQDDESDEGSGDDAACIFSTFCVLFLFVLYLIYVSAKKKSEQSQSGRAPGQMQGYHQRPGYRYPAPHKGYPPRTTRYPPRTQAYPPKPTPQRKDVKCDLCSSKNLRFFEKGFVKCNDCRHVFYISEGYSRRRGR
jgi:hypothetical protein